MAEKPDILIYNEPPKPTPENPKPEWVKVGTGWVHKDGKGFNVSMDDGTRLVIRARDQRGNDADAHAQT